MADDSGPAVTEHEGEPVNTEQLAALCRVLGYLPDEVVSLEADYRRVVVETVDRRTLGRHRITRYVS